MRLVNVACVSLDELLLDYEDFLRQRGLRQWIKEDDPEAREVREVGKQMPADQSNPLGENLYTRWLNHDNSMVVANALICLIHQTNYLLDQQIGALEREFIEEGGYSERLAGSTDPEAERAARK